MQSVPRALRVSILFIIVSLFWTQSLTAQSTPAINHVVVVAMENHSYGDVVGNSSMPYLNGLINQYGLAQNFIANVHGSFPDYAMLTTGELITLQGFGLPDDFPISIDNLARELTAAGKTWRVYAESIPNTGYTGGDVYPYAKIHNPFAYTTDVLNNSSLANNMVPFSQFASDLSSNSLPNFAYIVPNEENDAHDCPNGGSSCSDATILNNADQWLQANISPLLSNSQFQQSGLLVIWWDEGNGGDNNAGGQVAITLVGPTVKPGFRSSKLYHHEHLLRTICEALGLGFPGASVYVNSMGEFFGANNTPGSITGKVTDSSTAAALTGATVSYSGGSTTTDSNGDYTLSGVAAGTYNVTASQSGYTSKTSSVTVSAGNASTLNFALTANAPTPGSITGKVTDSSTGATLSGATVSYSGGSTTTDTNGNYTLSNVTPGTYNVTASHSGYNNQTSSVTVTAGTASTLNFALSATPPTAGAITGKVTDSSTGAVLSGTSVSYSGGSTTSDANGNYTLTNVAAGTYTVTASHSGYTSKSSSVTVSSGATSTLNFALTAVSSGPGTIKGQVTNVQDPTEDIQGATVSYSGGSTTTDSNGNYTLSNVPAGTYNVTATKTGWFGQTKSVTVTSGATTTANFTFATGGQVGGTVTDSNGNPLGSAAVKITGGALPTTVNTSTDASGNYNSDWVPVGNYTVTVTLSGFTTQSQTTTVNTGAVTTLNFTMH